SHTHTDITHTHISSHTHRHHTHISLTHTYITHTSPHTHTHYTHISSSHTHLSHTHTSPFPPALELTLLELEIITSLIPIPSTSDSPASGHWRGQEPTGQSATRNSRAIPRSH